MAKPSKTAKLVITSIVITLIVLAAFTLVFINFIVPAYQITEDQIYSVLTRLFPVLIGLILIQIGVIAAKKGEPEYKDTIDKLSPNAYDSALYTDPKDDPMLRGRIDPEMFGTGAKAAGVKEVVKEVPVEVVKEVPVEVVREVEVPIERIREVQVPVEVVKEVPVEKIVEKEVPVEKVVEKIVEKEVPVEVIKEVPVEKEVVREVPVEVLKQVPVEVVKEVPVERIVEKEVPVEVVKEVPVEVIKEVTVEKEVNIAAPPEMLSFHDVLREETKAAQDMDYDLSLVAIKERDGLTEESIEAAFGEDTLVFSEGGCFYAILPLYSKEEAEQATEELQPRNVISVTGGEPDAIIREAARF